MSTFNFTTPREAVHAMTAAGAAFSVKRRDDGLSNFTYRVADGGDLQQCRRILEEVRGKPPQFFAAFRCAVHDLVTSTVRGAA